MHQTKLPTKPCFYQYHSACLIPDPWADPKSRSPLQFQNLHHRSIRAQNWGTYFLDPPGGRGCTRVESAPESGGRI